MDFKLRLSTKSDINNVEIFKIISMLSVDHFSNKTRKTGDFYPPRKFYDAMCVTASRMDAPEEKEIQQQIYME